MATIEPTKADVLRAIETEQDWWLAMIDTAQTTGPLNGDEALDGAWTFKELLAHIDGWRGWTLARFEAAADGAAAPIPPWPLEIGADGDEEVDAINAWFDERAHQQTLDEVVAASKNRLSELHAVVARMSADELLTPGRFARFGPDWVDLPLGPALIGYSVSHVHDEHAPLLETWLTKRAGQHVELGPTPSNFGYVE